MPCEFQNTNYAALEDIFKILEWDQKGIIIEADI